MEKLSEMTLDCFVSFCTLKWTGFCLLLIPETKISADVDSVEVDNHANSFEML